MRQTTNLSVALERRLGERCVDCMHRVVVGVFVLFVAVWYLSRVEWIAIHFFLHWSVSPNDINFLIEK